MLHIVHCCYVIPSFRRLKIIMLLICNIDEVSSKRSLGRFIESVSTNKMLSARKQGLVTRKLKSKNSDGLFSGYT